MSSSKPDPRFEPEAYIYVDGGSSGNPGPSGIAFVVVSPLQKVICAHSKYIGQATNNIAEYTALYYALRRAISLGLKSVIVRSDAELVVKQLNGQYKVKSQRLLPIHLACKKAIRAFDRFKLEFIPRSENARADKMVRRVIKSHLSKKSDSQAEQGTSSAG